MAVQVGPPIITSYPQSTEWVKVRIRPRPARRLPLEYGSDLSGWTPVSIPATSAGIVEITPGSPSDHVKVTIPSGGSQIFVRLKVSQ
jgi:hypothetical protein